MEEIESIKRKIKWLENSHEESIQRIIELQKEFEKIKDTSTTEVNAPMKIKIFFYEKLADLFNYRIGDAKSYVKHLENPEDIYLSAHTSSTVTDYLSNKIMKDLKNIEEFLALYGKKYEEINKSRDILQRILEDDRYMIP